MSLLVLHLSSTRLDVRQLCLLGLGSSLRTSVRCPQSTLQFAESSLFFFFFMVGGN